MNDRRFLVMALLAAALIYVVSVGVRCDRASGDIKPIIAPSARKSAGTLAATQIGDHKAWTLADQRGKVVLINYFATWCPPCRAETPALVRAAGKYRARGFEIVGVNREGVGPAETNAAVATFVQQYHIPFPVVREDTLPLPDPFGGTALPTSIFVDRNGRIAAAHVGALSDEILAAQIQQLLDEPLSPK